MNRIILRLLFFFLMPVSSQALDLGQFTSPDLLIRFEPPLEKAAEKILLSYPDIKSSVERKLGWKIGFVPTVVLIHESSEFRKLTQSDLVTAYAVPRKNLIVMNYSKLDRTPVDLQSTLEHELYHLLLHQHIDDARLPRWLDEGVAQWASGGIADIINPENKDILKQAVLSQSLLSLDSISRSFPSQARGLILAYQESRSFVEFIVSEYGEEKLIAVLNSLKNGRQAEQAVSDNLSVGLAALEQRWSQALTRKYSWTSYVANHIYWIVFVAAALITVAGYIRFRLRLKNYRDEDDENAVPEETDNR